MRDKLHATGLFLLLLPMVVFGVQHFVYTRFVANIVPSWMPWHLFWTYFVAIALFAASAAIVANRQAYLASSLLGIMILLFVQMIHTSLVFVNPSDILPGSPFGDMPGRLNNCFKDLGLSGAAFILAGTYPAGRKWAMPLGRGTFAICMAAFGILHALYPDFAPGVQPMYTNVAFPLPGHPFWVYLTASIFLAAAVSIVTGREIRLAAATLGIMILLFDLLTWGPRFAAHPGDLWGNWLKDIGMAGGAFILSGASSKPAAASKAAILQSQHQLQPQ